MSWHVSLKARVGEVDVDVELAGDAAPLALIGPNGAGKTSVLRWMAGRPIPGAEGVMGIDELTLVDTAKGAWLDPEDRRVGYLPQGYGLFDHLRVVDNVAFGLASRGVARGDRRARALEMLRELSCEDLAERHPASLSGGERQKVALARALLVEPRLLLLDEPMSALDASARRRMRAFLAAQLGAGGAPAIVVTHDVRDVRAMASVVCVMEGGKIVQQGSPDELAGSPASEFVEEFFGA